MGGLGVASGGVDGLKRVDSDGGGGLTTTSLLAYKLLLDRLAFAILFRLSETVMVLTKSELSPGVVNSPLLYFRLGL